jgi:hypothetical protein
MLLQLLLLMVALPQAQAGRLCRLPLIALP